MTMLDLIINARRHRADQLRAYIAELRDSIADMERELVELEAVEATAAVDASPEPRSLAASVARRAVALPVLEATGEFIE